MSGLIQFYLACRESGIKPILGVELTQPGKPNEQVVLIARNARGYGDLCEIITRRHLDADFSFEKTFSTVWPDLFLFTNFPHLLELLAATPNRPNLYGELVNNSKLTRQRSKALESKANALDIPLIVSNNSFFLQTGD
jgi:DNA polymerase III alpha subunit